MKVEYLDFTNIVDLQEEIVGIGVKNVISIETLKDSFYRVWFIDAVGIIK